MPPDKKTTVDFSILFCPKENRFYFFDRGTQCALLAIMHRYPGWRAGNTLQNARKSLIALSIWRHSSIMIYFS